jgi:hypothetical protein
VPDIVHNFNISPYYDTTKDEVEKGYSRFLAVEGRALQNRELNIMQGLAHENNKRISDLMIEDGSVISGCSFTKKKIEKQCFLTSGEIYLNGDIISTESYLWDFSEVPEELSIVYFEVFPTVVDEIEDPSLYDPAEAYESHGQPGGHRLKFLATPKIAVESEYNSLIIENKNTVPVCKIYDRVSYGPIKPKPVFGKLYDYMAQRTYDSMGDFLSQGMEVTTTTNVSNAKELYDIKITAGKSYIRGYEYTYTNDTTVSVKNAIDTKTNAGDSDIAPFVIQYVSGVNKYSLSENYVKQIDSVTALVEVSSISLSFDAITRTNNLPAQYTSIYSIDEVYDYSGGGGTKVTYSLVTDYSIENSNRTIVWKTTGSSPAGTFYVDITILRNLTENDYYLVLEDSASYIQFSTSGIKPKVNTPVTIEFTWFLSRIDLVYLTVDGYIRVKYGISADKLNLRKPSIPTGSLPLAYITVIPNTSVEYFNIESFNIYRVPVTQLQDMKKTISNLEYNFAMTELENLAQSKHLEQDNITTLRNIFSDAITTYSKVDLGNVEFDSTVDILKSEVTLPLNIDHITADDIQVVDSNGNTVNISKPISLDVLGTEICDYQPFATHSVDLAPFLFRAMQPSITCTPTNITHITDTYSTTILWLPNRIVYSTQYVDNYITKNITNTITATSFDSRSSRNRTVTTSSTTSNTVLNTSSKTVSSIIGEEVVETKKLDFVKIPQPNIYSPAYIKIFGKNFLPNTEILITLDDLSVLEPVFADTTFQDTEYNYKGDRTVLRDRATPPSITNQLTDHTWDDDVNEDIPRPNVWKWEYNASTGYYYIKHPSSTTNCLTYRYRKSDKTWQYLYTGDTWQTLEKSPSWLKWVLRSPWINDSINEMTDETKKGVIIETNTHEPVTNISYTSSFVKNKTTTITDGYGDFEVLVKLPSNVKVGSHVITCRCAVGLDFDKTVRLYSKTSFIGDTYIRHWETQIYKRKIELLNTIIYRDYITTVTTTRRIENIIGTWQDVRTGNDDRGNGGGTDPVAQTFRLKENMFLSGIDLYFISRAAETRSNIFFYIKETTESGIPTGDILYYDIIPRNSINIGTNYPATHIEFDYPVYVEANKEYAFIIGSSTNGYRILYAKIGNKDLITNQQVLYNANLTGVMLESSNSYTWSPVQDADIKYILYRTRFNTNDKSYFILNANQNGVYGNQSFVMCNTTIPYMTLDDTEVITEYKINGTNVLTSSAASWIPLNLEEQYIFEPSVEYLTQMNHHIKVTLTSDSDKVTPIVNFGNFESFYGKYKNSGSYIQTPIKLDE